ncbi:tetraspanin-11 [Culicoides brevitarsis]|uniref:tetraspanin-11 n=1 Tax=Culicoides brevitarsis TaxID=469753 RepID=UPI00307BBC1D
MKFCKIFNHRLLLAVCNLLFMTCGIGLLAVGFYVLCDGPRVLLSRLIISSLDNSPLTNLSQPFFFYVALGIIVAGLIASIAAALGVWASCINRYCILSLYFLIVIILLFFEFAICLIITMWPQCLGLTLNTTAMVKTLQGYYGIPGEEQFTAAIDLAQVKFQCCGINTSINYDTSMWKLQEGLGKKELTVPLTCCHLSNKDDRDAYLDPKPVNTTLCQALQLHDYEKHRYVDSCVDKIEQWYREQYIYFLGAGVLIALVEFSVLLSIILSCTRIYKKKPKRKTLEEIEVHREPITNIYHDGFPPTLPEIREVFVQPPPAHHSSKHRKQQHVQSFKPSHNGHSNGVNNYSVNRSYLV